MGLTKISGGLAAKALQQSDHIEIPSLDIVLDAPACDICGKPTWFNWGYKSPGRVICSLCWRKAEKAKPAVEASEWAWW